jgi:hypothetical protein
MMIIDFLVQFEHPLHRLDSLVDQMSSSNSILHDVLDSTSCSTLELSTSTPSGVISLRTRSYLRLFRLLY